MDINQNQRKSRIKSKRKAIRERAQKHLENHQKAPKKKESITYSCCGAIKKHQTKKKYFLPLGIDYRGSTQFSETVQKLPPISVENWNPNNKMHIKSATKQKKKKTRHNKQIYWRKADSSLIAVWHLPEPNFHFVWPCW